MFPPSRGSVRAMPNRLDATIARPPPRGVGCVWELRELGVSNSLLPKWVIINFENISAQIKVVAISVIQYSIRGASGMVCVDGENCISVGDGVPIINPDVF